MSFKILEEFLGDCLELPVRCTDGEVRTFRIPSPPAEDGLMIEKIMAEGLRAADGGAPLNSQALDDAEELDLYRMALGTAYDDVHKHCDWSRFRHVAMTAVMWITGGLDLAEQYWNADGDPKAPAPNRAARRASSAAASTTKRRASTSGTSTRKATSRARKAAQT